MARLDLSIVVDAAKLKKFAAMENTMKEKVYSVVNEWGRSVVEDTRRVIGERFHHIERKGMKKGEGLASSIRQDLRRGVGNEFGTMYFRSRTDRGTKYGFVQEKGHTFDIPNIVVDFPPMKILGLVRLRKIKASRSGVSTFRAPGTTPNEPILFTQSTKAHTVTIPARPFLGPTIERKMEDGKQRLLNALEKVGL